MNKKNSFERFFKFAQERKFSLKKISSRDYGQGFNFYLCGVDSEKKPKETPIFVKFRSGKALKDKWIWVEILDNMGKPGWLYNRAHFIFLETEAGFLVAPREALLKHVNDFVNFQTALVSNPWSAKYSLYQPKNKLSQLCLVKLSNLESLHESFSWFDLSK